MIEKRRVLTIGATLLVAFATGHIMQNGFAFAAKTSNASTEVEKYPADVTGQEVLGALPTPPPEMIIPKVLPLTTQASESRVFDVAMLPSDGSAQTDIPTPLFSRMSCDTTLTAKPEAGALVRVNLDAPCIRNQRILVEHGDLEFADATNSDGTFEVVVPAMKENGPFIVSFDDGSRIEAETPALDLHGYDRVALTWRGEAKLHIHAFENGADHGEPGHVWAGASRDPSVSNISKGGFLTRLGDPTVLNPRLAEVYSLPAGQVRDEGAVRLVVEAEVTAGSCGTEISGNTHKLSHVGETSVTAITLTMPDCGSVGGFLVLKNLLQDLKIARN